MSQGKKKCLLLLDRSELAENILKLLFADDPILVSTLHHEELEAYLRKQPCNALVINSNYITLNETAFFQALKNSPELQQTPKIFLCREDEQKLQQQLSEIPHSTTAIRPFFPEAFKQLLDGVLHHE